MMGVLLGMPIVTLQTFSYNNTPNGVGFEEHEGGFPLIHQSGFTGGGYPSTSFNSTRGEAVPHPVAAHKYPRPKNPNIRDANSRVHNPEDKKSILSK